MSSLRSVLDELEAVDPASLTDSELEDEFDEVHRAGQVLEARRLRLLAEVERRKTFARDGHLSATSWLAAKYKVAFPHAAQQVRTASALEEMPETREALASGELSGSAVGVLVSAREVSPEEFGKAEGMLVEAAQSLPAREFHRAVGAWRRKVGEGSALQESERLRQRRRLEVSPVPSGMVRVEGELDPENAQSLITALRAVMDSEVRSGAPEDGRAPTQRRADALGEVCRAWLDRADRPTVGGERPQVMVLVDLEALNRRCGGTAELVDTGSVPSEIARMLACDASISRVVTKGGSEPLDVGRKTPVVPAAIRRAVMVRDRRCRFPGCDRPPGWCQPHHIEHWAHGGRTALSNLILLCSRHHRIMHVEGFTVEPATAGRSRFRRPDGTILEDRAPP